MSNTRREGLPCRDIALTSLKAFPTFLLSAHSYLHVGPQPASYVGSSHSAERDARYRASNSPRKERFLVSDYESSRLRSSPSWPHHHDETCKHPPWWFSGTYAYSQTLPIQAYRASNLPGIFSQYLRFDCRRSLPPSGLAQRQRQACEKTPHLLFESNPIPPPLSVDLPRCKVKICNSAVRLLL